MTASFTFLTLILQAYVLAVVVHVVIGYLVQYGVTTMDQPLVVAIRSFTDRFVEPALNAIRKFVRPFRNVDLSPLILILGLLFIGQIFVLGLWLALFWVILQVINFLLLIVIVHLGVIYLARFGLISFSTPLVGQIHTATSAIVEPILEPMRRYIPAVSNMDITPIILFAVLFLLRLVIVMDVLKAV